MFLPIITVDENAPNALALPITIWTIVIICFIALTIVFVKQLKKLNASEKTAFIIFAIIGFIIIGCMGYAIVTAICALYCARKENKKEP